MTADLVGLLAVNALFLAAGLGVTGAAGWWRGVRAARRAVGVSYLAGVASFGVAAQLLYVCGASLATWEVVAICGVLALGALRALRGPSDAAASARWRLAALRVALMVTLIAVDLWYQPLWAYDSWTFWTPKAHALWALHGLHECLTRTGKNAEAQLVAHQLRTTTALADVPIEAPCFCRTERDCCG